MNILSITYRKAPQEIRERFSFTKEEQKTFADDACRTIEPVTQCVVLSTCNRMELYFDGGSAAIRSMEQFLCREKQLSLKAALPYFLIYEGDGAVRHLMRVVSGIDSMVLGEDEILRQVKEAYQRALEGGTTGASFNTIFQMAFRSAKQIKNETALSETPVSYGTLAANEVFALPGKQKTVLVIGATGKIGSITAKNLAYKPSVTVYGTSRSCHSSEDEWNPGASVHMLPYSERYRLMDQADAVVSATTSPHYTVTQEQLEKSLTIRKPRLFLDLAVPADIDRSIADMEGVTLREIDWFQKTAEENTRKKRHAAEEAAEAAERSAEEILKELRLRRLMDRLPELRHAVSDYGVEPMLSSLRDSADREQVEAVAAWLEDYLNSLT